MVKHLQIVFKEEPVEGSMNIKFPKYLKHLKSFIMMNISDKNFTDTLFDMAS
jgi:hypothetical protein